MKITNGQFTWDDDDEPALKNVNLHLEKGKLAAVVGPVGSGKSSLVYSLLGETLKMNGTVNIDGSVAFVAQQAWIQNATLQVRSSVAYYALWHLFLNVSVCRIIFCLVSQWRKLTIKKY